MIRQGWESDSGIEELLAMTQNAFGQIEFLTAEVNISVHGRNVNGNASAAIVYKRTDKMRIDVMGPLFKHVLSAVVNDDSMAIVTSSESWHGTISEGLIRYLPVLDLGEYDLRYALFGIVAPWKTDEKVTLSHSRADRAIVTVAQDVGERKIWVDLHRGFVFREEVITSTGLYWQRDFFGHRKILLPGPDDMLKIYLPKSVRITRPHSVLDIKFEEAFLSGGEFSANLF